jgi:hypothetical protein
MAKATKARRAKSSGGGKKWIQGAIKRPGALTKKAKASGMTPMAYARAHKHSKGLTGQQARAALNMQKRKR